MAEVSRAHTEIGPELRRLAQAILDGIDPAVRAAAMKMAGTGGVQGVGKCQQVWCPVCALAAVVTGEQHPLVTVIADHSVALLEVIRAMVDDIEASASVPPDDPDRGAPGAGATGVSGEQAAPNGSATNGGARKTRYQSIPVTLQE